MFGYVNIDKPNIIFKDYDTYKAYYCGLCKTLGTHTNSQLMRFSVNFDITFLTLLAHNARNLQPTFEKERCIAHPVGSKFYVVQNNEIQECIADINVMLGYYKLDDDVYDNKSVTRRMGRAFFSGKYKKAAEKYPQLDKVLRTNYLELRELEGKKCAQLDRLADKFAKILVAVGEVACGKTDANLQSLCYNLGRWIYIIDAYDDLEKDIEGGVFNPLAVDGQLDDEKRKSIYDTVQCSLRSAIGIIIDCYNAMEISISEGALSNV
ncbi:MAG: DUF5685 family protein, partial [Bacillota bacterium]